jgi:hypothetical protein
VFVAGQFLLALVSGYEMMAALHVITVTTGPLVVSFLIVSARI